MHNRPAFHSLSMFDIPASTAPPFLHPPGFGTGLVELAQAWQGGTQRQLRLVSTIASRITHSVALAWKPEQMPAQDERIRAAIPSPEAPSILCLQHRTRMALKRPESAPIMLATRLHELGLQPANHFVI
jgi:hypothetical protein